MSFLINAMPQDSCGEEYISMRRPRLYPVPPNVGLSFPRVNEPTPAKRKG
jgi:hypothetical protein